MVREIKETKEVKAFLRSIDDCFCKPTPDTHVQIEIRHYCDCCKQTTQFRYYGTQFHGGERAFDLYNCPCGSTKSFNPTPYWVDKLAEHKKKQKADAQKKA